MPVWSLVQVESEAVVCELKRGMGQGMDYVLVPEQVVALLLTGGSRRAPIWIDQRTFVCRCGSTYTTGMVEALLFAEMLSSWASTCVLARHVSHMLSHVCLPSTYHTC